MAPRRNNLVSGADDTDRLADLWIRVWCSTVGILTVAVVLASVVVFDVL
jgi:hypothetical protein